jgi:hypothetical protein
MSVIALVAAVLFYRGLSAARSIDVGFDVRGAVVFTLDPALSGRYDRNRLEEFYQQLESRLIALPGVQSVSRASSIPLDGNSRSLPLTEGVSADYFSVEENYFSTIGIRLVSGQAFSIGDAAGGEPVVVNETLAKRLWNGTPALGRVFTVGTPPGKKLTVVGVARSDASRRLGDRPRPILWRSLSHDPFSRLTVIVRTRGDTAGTLARIPPIIRSLDPQLPVIGLRTLGEQVELAYSAAENGALAGTMFGVLAALLAAGGLFGALMYNVSQRTREIGLRQALGADWSDILRLITGSGIRLTLMGMSIALVAILFIPGRMSVLIYGVSPHDPVLIAVASGLFLLIAAIASLGPALKALSIEPSEALRAD